MKFEDHFSQLAKTYSVYRPLYPEALFRYLADKCREQKLAWDCGTGNGQAAASLANHFEKVIASDASRDQIAHAIEHPKVSYIVERAEDISIPQESVDLVTAAAAAHWFNFDAFYNKVNYVLKPAGIIAIWGYNNIKISPAVDLLIARYMNDILVDYWPARFQYLKAGYKNIPFHFKEFVPPQFEMTARWNLDQLIGFLNSWSGTKNYIETKGENPISILWDELIKAWGDENTTYPVEFPLFMRIGIKEN